MRFWWVNQNQTWRQEVGGGYLWSPKLKSNDQVNPFYESMREVAPGDVILSFRDTLIAAMGIAYSNCYECPKPPEFGVAGPNWGLIGWKVDVRFVELLHKIRPKDHMDELRRYLPTKYSPPSAAGDGSQSVYLTELPELLFRALAQLIGPEATHELDAAALDVRRLPSAILPAQDTVVWEEHLKEGVLRDAALESTEKEAIVLARRGQGLFRQRVSSIESRCRVTGVSNPGHLRASHCKPWRDSNNEERLNGENGLLLTPSIDHLFDRGFISFATEGTLIISPVAHKPSLERMGIKTTEIVRVGGFTAGQRGFLEYHRDSVLLQARRSRRDPKLRGDRM
jgi:putative restriction endonuclease